MRFCCFHPKALWYSGHVNRLVKCYIQEKYYERAASGRTAGRFGSGSTFREKVWIRDPGSHAVLSYVRAEETSERFLFQPGRSLRDVVCLGWPIVPAYMSPNTGGEGVVLRGLSHWVQLCTWSPNKLLRSYLIFNLWLVPTDTSTIHRSEILLANLPLFTWYTLFCVLVGWFGLDFHTFSFSPFYRTRIPRRGSAVSSRKAFARTAKRYSILASIVSSAVPYVQITFFRLYK